VSTPAFAGWGEFGKCCTCDTQRQDIGSANRLWSLWEMLKDNALRYIHLGRGYKSPALDTKRLKRMMGTY
jgi:hypothetical protein